MDKEIIILEKDIAILKDGEGKQYTEYSIYKGAKIFISKEESTYCEGDIVRLEWGEKNKGGFVSIPLICSSYGKTGVEVMEEIRQAIANTP